MHVRAILWNFGIRIRPQPIMLKFLPIMLLSNAQNLHLGDTYCTNEFQLCSTSDFSIRVY